MLEPVKNSLWNVSATARIPAPAGKVWETIASPSSLESCHPFVKTNPVEEWPGVGARDVVFYYSGLIYHREFCAWEEEAGYDLRIGTEGNLNHKVFWRVQSCGERESTLSITVRALDTAGWEKLVYWLPVLVYYRPLLTQYLDSLVSGYRYFITTGKPVVRNQFGALRFFSPPV